MSVDEKISESGPPTVPGAELRRRIDSLQQWMATRDLDGAFLLQNTDVYYFSGTMQRAVLFVPAGGQPLLAVIKSVQRAREESSLAQVVPLSGREGLLPLLADFGHRAFNRVGLELDVLPAAQYQWFRRALPRSAIVDVSPGIRTLRMIKSPYEVDQIRRAAAILDTGYREIRASIREGVAELEIDGLLYAIARREGHMGVMRMRAWNQEMMNAHVFCGTDGAVVSCCETPGNGTGISPAMPQGAGVGRIARNRPIYIDYGVTVNGYHADQTRTLVLGELDGTLARAHACGRDVLAELEAAIRPGVSCAAIYAMADAIAERSGLGDSFMGHGEGKVRFVGHGIGLEIDELPVLAPKFDVPIQAGMVFALEPKFSFPGLGIVGIEDDYLVTADGLERLTLTEQALIRIT